MVAAQPVLGADAYAPLIRVVRLVRNDGFAIGAVADANDFSIAAGHCLVEGWTVVNESALSYTEQAQPPALTPPESDRTDTVYLDVWEREVGSGEDDQIVNPIIGIETCVRTKREWVVRVAEGATELPAPPPGHVFYPLATLDRKAGEDGIGVVTDLRRTGLTLASLKERTESLEVEKVDRAGDRITGDLVVDGNVGIGTTSPGAPLQIPFKYNTPNGGLRLYEGADDYWDVRNMSHCIAIDYVGTTRFVVQYAGNVGIGTTEPKARLDVAGTTRARSLELNPGDSDLPDFVRRLNVLTHRHVAPSGKEGTPMHFHIRTPDDKQTGQMWRYDLRGYAYRARAPLDLVWVGHYYYGNIVNDRASCRSDTLEAVPALEVSQYTGADGHLYLKFGPVLPYLLNFVLDYQCYVERVVHDREGFSVQAREDSGNF